jgi:hypothetical protein
MAIKQQIDLMSGLKVSTKKEFVRTFARNYSNSRTKYLEVKTTVEKQLSAINKDYGIVNYHSKGFIFNWGEIHSCGVNWGEYRSSFNIECPEDIITVGGNYECDYFYNGGGIHPNIHADVTTLQLPTKINGYYVPKVCLDRYLQVPQIITFTNKGLIYEVLQVVKNIFDNNEPGDGLWDDLLLQCCICGDPIPNIESDDDDLCEICRYTIGGK